MNKRNHPFIFRLAVCLLFLSACGKSPPPAPPSALSTAQPSLPSTATTTAQPGPTGVTSEAAYLVTSPADSGPGTLRAALQNVSAGRVITFDPAAFPPAQPVTITLNSKLPPINSDRITIDASNAGVILDGDSIGKTPETLLLDDVSLTVNGGQNLLLNGDFSAGLGHWRPQDQDAGATRNLESADFHSAPASYAWYTLALVNAGNTLYDAADSSAALKLWNEPKPASSWLPVKAGDQIELRFWYKNGPLNVQLQTASPQPSAQQLNQQHFERKADWTEAVVRQSMPAGVSGIGLNFQFDHSDRFTSGLDVHSDGNTIQGLQIVNFPQAGVALNEASDNLVGGVRGIGAGPLGQANRLSGNGSFGVGIWGKTSANNTIKGNIIGTDLSGMASQGGSRDGITVIEAHDNLFEGNLINSYLYGIYICCTETGRNRIVGNWIGAAVEGTPGLGNRAAGVVLDRAGHNLVGPGNQIAYNPLGVIITGVGAIGNTISQNSLYANAQSGIQINLPQDVQPAAARLAAFDLANGSVQGEACPGCIVEVFSTADNQGKVFEGQVAASADGKFTFTKGAPLAGPQVSITVTNAEGTTSGFILPLTAAAPAPAITSSAQYTPQPWVDAIIRSLQPANLGSLNSPTGVVVAPDGTLFVADTLNHRILHMDASGKTSLTWGSFEESKNDKIAAEGKFNQPWGLAISPEGFIFVSDTWNHRIQKFSLDGTFVTAWGGWGQGTDPYQFWGPRGVVVTPDGYLIVADTGNKRLVVYDQDGKFVSQLGGEGDQLGQFNEPVGIAMDSAGNIFVADAWNKRVQVLAIDAQGNLSAKSSWPVSGWEGDSEWNKPWIAVSGGHIFVTDPLKYAVLEFDPQGKLLQTYDFSALGQPGSGILTGIAADSRGGLWVSDTANHLIYHLSPGN
jgi:hypothetical protein